MTNGISVFTVFDRIQADPQFAEVPIAAISALDLSLATAEARKKGFGGFISKPVDFALFAGRVATVADGGQVWFAV